ncbi:hypothetical protein IQ268_26805 [Oculatella sp. LEGE 06141]|uniref:hypothetical protein n=1 Tax=Oculatella sp. LEGE 06141 TaxID=1828648 RepID=UPI00187E52E0|nr:hypothetical protein [Oculatella sp. LEGE 06141]MBE9182181.1 hypothetical protein [Oculatella sp. LEGE 06141]
MTVLYIRLVRKPRSRSEKPFRQNTSADQIHLQAIQASVKAQDKAIAKKHNLEASYRLQRREFF